MDRYWMLFLAVGLALLAFLLLNHPQRGSPKLVEVTEADGSLAIELRSSRELEDVAAGVPPPILVQDGIGEYGTKFVVSKELLGGTRDVSAMVLVEHGTSTFGVVLVSSAALKTSTSRAAPSVLVEHASGTFAEILRPCVSSGEYLTAAPPLLVEHVAGALGEDFGKTLNFGKVAPSILVTDADSIFTTNDLKKIPYPPALGNSGDEGGG